MTRRILPALAQFVAGVVVAAGAGIIPALLDSHTALAWSHVANVLPGYGSQCEDWYWQSGIHPCWHFDEGADWAALDLDNAQGSGDANKPVYWQQTGTDWSNVFTTVRFEQLPGSCTGIRVVLSPYPGEFHYMHILPDPSVVGTTTQNWYSVPGYVLGWRLLGTTAPTQPGCVWYGPHLHQSGDVSWSTPIYANWFASTPAGTGPRHMWSSSLWTHQIKW